MAEWVERPSPVWEFKPRGFELWLIQTNDIKIDTCCFLPRRLAFMRIEQGLLGSGSGQFDWVGYQVMRSWCLWPRLPVRQQYKVHCHMLIPVLIWPEMFPRREATTSKQLQLYNLIYLVRLASGYYGLLLVVLHPSNILDRNMTGTDLRRCVLLATL